MNLSDPYRETFTDALPHAHQVADPFYVIRLINSTIDDMRRRLQHETTGGRGTKDDPLHRMRGLLLKAAGRVTERGCAEVNKLGCALDRWRTQTADRHCSQGHLGRSRTEATRRVRIPRVS